MAGPVGGGHAQPVTVDAENKLNCRPMFNHY